MARRQNSDEQWREWIREQAQSGLSIAAFCEWIGVSQNAFYVRRRRLESESADSGNTGFPGLIPVSVVSDAIVEIELPCGATLRIPDQEHSLRRVLGILLEAEPIAAGPNTSTAGGRPR